MRVRVKIDNVVTVAKIVLPTYIPERKELHLYTDPANMAEPLLVISELDQEEYEKTIDCLEEVGHYDLSGLDCRFYCEALDGIGCRFRDKPTKVPCAQCK